MKKILLFLIGAFILIQFFPVEKPEVANNNPNDLISKSDVPKNVAILLKNACYDCHSNESKFPWYSNVAPLKWSIYDHIKEGREDLNFSNWNELTTDDKADLLDDISEVISENEMPLEEYVLLHSEANLSEADKEAIVTWADEMLEKIYE